MTQKGNRARVGCRPAQTPPGLEAMPLPPELHHEEAGCGQPAWEMPQGHRVLAQHPEAHRSVRPHLPLRSHCVPSPQLCRCPSVDTVVRAFPKHLALPSLLSVPGRSRSAVQQTSSKAKSFRELRRGKRHHFTIKDLPVVPGGNQGLPPLSGSAGRPDGTFGSLQASSPWGGGWVVADIPGSGAGLCLSRVRARLGRRDSGRCWRCLRSRPLRSRCVYGGRRVGEGDGVHERAQEPAVWAQPWAIRDSSTVA